MAQTTQTLVRMANQIARFFESQRHEAGVPGVADHIAAFWSPQMRRDINAYIDAGGEELRPLALEGLKFLQARSADHVKQVLESSGGVSVGTRPGSDAG
ncbi:formate dehydrogenase subunit delta [Aureimonas fodinaquatilis]|uniref:Formate dehydrogenase subunit delta n=1 Tax=Aureimonas fodinaquatilis TaxID=2565783 RepID=A0A5B0DZI9_9HYPH|nr:formate dehydrogenase subunit delta [Aureimonas fodinaquatilis]KAA0970629.1 formate dehydrogenase subunit delta [Aureimonas fodinaquatilis]